MRLSATLIVRNEAPILAACLEKLAGFDEIVVVDTGSVDDTVAVARRFTEHVFADFAWCDDFSAARNHAKGKATGDWILALDADHELLVSVDVVRSEAAKAEAAQQLTALTKGVYPGGSHWMGGLFRNDPRVRWVGAVHECITPATRHQTAVELKINQSQSKAADPERNLRILRKSDLSQPRNLFYLGKELVERHQFQEAIPHLVAYLARGDTGWLPERCDADLLLARCYWNTGRGDEARAHCLEAIRNNPDFKEALLFMGELYFEPQKHRWLRLAAAATNEDVLFVRT